MKQMIISLLCLSPPHPIPLPLFILYFLSLNGRGQKVRVKKNNPLTQSLSRQGERENKGK